MSPMTCPICRCCDWGDDPGPKGDRLILHRRYSSPPPALGPHGHVGMAEAFERQQPAWRDGLEVPGSARDAPFGCRAGWLALTWKTSPAGCVGASDAIARSPFRQRPRRQPIKIEGHADVSSASLPIPHKGMGSPDAGVPPTRTRLLAFVGWAGARPSAGNHPANRFRRP
jgi:hypothetical protein